MQLDTVLAPSCAALLPLRQSPSVPTWRSVWTPSFCLETDVACCEIGVLHDEPWPALHRGQRDHVINYYDACRKKENSTGVTRRRYDGALQVASKETQVACHRASSKPTVFQAIGSGVTRRNARCQTVLSERTPGGWCRPRPKQHTLSNKYQRNSLKAY